MPKWPSPNVSLVIKVPWGVLCPARPQQHLSYPDTFYRPQRSWGLLDRSSSKIPRRYDRYGNKDFAQHIHLHLGQGNVFKTSETSWGFTRNYTKQTLPKRCMSGRAPWGKTRSSHGAASQKHFSAFSTLILTVTKPAHTACWHLALALQDWVTATVLNVWYNLLQSISFFTTEQMDFSVRFTLPRHTCKDYRIFHIKPAELFYRRYCKGKVVLATLFSVFLVLNFFDGIVYLV